MLKKFVVFLSGMFVAASAFAVPPTTVAELTAGISFADVSLGILAVAGLLVAVYVVLRSVNFVISTINSNGRDADYDSVRAASKNDSDRVDYFNTHGHWPK